MARAVDPKRTRKALKALQALKDAAAAESGGVFSDWEDTFIAEVTARLETYGSAFADYGKGAPDEALSRLQQQKLKEIRKKTQQARGPEADARPMKRNGFKRKPRSET